jgi:RNA polymerase sigma-70 factor (ECF subfamily)
VTSFSIYKELPLVLQNEQAVGNVRDQVAQLFTEAREDVYRYLLTLGLHPPQAQEATQDVFLRLYTVLKKGEEIQNQRAWIFRVAHNHGLKVRQKQKDVPAFDPELEAIIADPGKSAEKQLIERERMLRLHKAIQGLSEQQRRCLFLRMEGLRYNEIGETLGIGAPTVGEFLRRALARLKKVIHE